MQNINNRLQKIQIIGRWVVEYLQWGEENVKKIICVLFIISVICNVFCLKDAYQKYRIADKLEKKLIFSISMQVYDVFDGCEYESIDGDEHTSKDKETKNKLLIRKIDKMFRITDIDLLSYKNKNITDEKWLYDLNNTSEYFLELNIGYERNKQLDKQGIKTLNEILRKGKMIGNILDSEKNYNKKYCNRTPFKSLKQAFSELGNMCKNEKKRLSKLRREAN